MPLLFRKFTSLSIFGLAALIAASGLFLADRNLGREYNESASALKGAVKVSQESDLRVLEGLVVYAVGRPVPEHALTDPDFGISFDGISFNRVVEILQWRERGEEIRQYRTRWGTDVVNSGQFQRPEGHRNVGALGFAPYGDQADTVFVDGVPVDAKLLGGLKTRMVPVTEQMFAAMPEHIRNRFALVDGRLVEGGRVTEDRSDPDRVGTNRVWFNVAQAREGLVVGIMQNGRIVAGSADTHAAIGSFSPGATSVDAVIESGGSDSFAHMFRVMSAFSLVGIGGAAVFRDLLRRQPVADSLKFGR